MTTMPIPSDAHEHHGREPRGDEVDPARGEKQQHADRESAETEHAGEVAALGRRPVGVVDGGIERQPRPVGGVQHEAEAAHDREHREPDAHGFHGPARVVGDPAAHPADDASSARTGGAARQTRGVRHATILSVGPPPHIGDRPGAPLRVRRGSVQG